MRRTFFPLHHCAKCSLYFGLKSHGWIDTHTGNVSAGRNCQFSENHCAPKCPAVMSQSNGKHRSTFSCSAESLPYSLALIFQLSLFICLKCKVLPDSPLAVLSLQEAVKEALCTFHLETIIKLNKPGRKMREEKAALVRRAGAVWTLLERGDNTDAINSA